MRPGLRRERIRCTGLTRYHCLDILTLDSLNVSHVKLHRHAVLRSFGCAHPDACMLPALAPPLVSQFDRVHQPKSLAGPAAEPVIVQVPRCLAAALEGLVV